MSFNRWSLAVLILLLGVAGWCHAVDPKATSNKAAVRIGLSRTLFRDVPSTLVDSVAKPFNSLMESQTGMRGELAVLKDAHHLAESIRQKQNDLVVMQGFEYAWLRREYPELTPLVVTMGLVPQCRVHLVTQREGNIQNLQELKGKNVLLGSGTKEHCRVYLEHCQKVENLQLQIQNRTSIDQALDQLLQEPDAATIVDSASWDAYKIIKPGLSKNLKVIEETECFPQGVILYRKDGLDENTLSKLRNGLLKAHQNTNNRFLLKLWSLKGFQKPPADYAAQCDNICKAFPPPTPAK